MVSLIGIDQLVILFLIFGKLQSKETNIMSPPKITMIDQLNYNGYENDISREWSELAEIDRKYASCGNIKDIREMTIRQFQNLFQTNQLTIYQLVVCYIVRIRKMNPFLHAVIEINPDAKKQALRLDYERFLGYTHKNDSLYGIPILLKDNIATVDKMQTCSGSPALLGYKPLYEASIVTFIRKAKGIILGKANLAEFANFRGNDIPNGWSGRGGQTHNPYSKNIDPLGSSTGSAVAVAANLCVCSVGTETDGSIVAPAEKANVVGLKTSHGGIVPIDGIIPISGLTQDTAGPFARTVEDLTIFMSIFRQQRDVLSKDFNSQRKSKTFRIGILRQKFWEASCNDTTQVQKIKQLNETLVKFGQSPYITIIDPVKAPPGAVEAISGDEVVRTLYHEFKYGLNNYLEQASYIDDEKGNSCDSNPFLSKYARMLTLRDIIEYNKAHPSSEGYQQDRLEVAELTNDIRNATYLNGRNENIKVARYLIDSVLKDYNLDAIAAPTTGGWFHKGTGKDASLYSYAAVAGYPYIIIPVGFIDGTFDGIGCLFHGPLHSEYKLLEVAKIYEEVTLGRVPPTFSAK